MNVDVYLAWIAHQILSEDPATISPLCGCGSLLRCTRSQRPAYSGHGKENPFSPYRLDAGGQHVNPSFLCSDPRLNIPSFSLVDTPNARFTHSQSEFRAYKADSPASPGFSQTHSQNGQVPYWLSRNSSNVARIRSCRVTSPSLWLCCTPVDALPAYTASRTVRRMIPSPGDVIFAGFLRSSSTYLDNPLGRASADMTSAGNWYTWIL